MKWMMMLVLAGGGYSMASNYKTQSSEKALAQDAQDIVTEIARVNRKRAEVGELSTGLIDFKHPLAEAPSLKEVVWQTLGYDFFAADGAGSCIIARASRRTLGPASTNDPKYSKLGFCANRFGAMEAYDKDGVCRREGRQLARVLGGLTVGEAGQ